MASESSIFRATAVRLVSIAGLALCISGLAVKARAQALTGRVFIEFQGGLIGRDMARVVTEFSGESKLLPTRQFVPTQTIGLCPILESQLAVPVEFCTAELLQAISTLNRREGKRINPNAINPILGVLLPDVVASTEEVKRIYDLSQQQQADRLATIEKNPSWNNIIQNKQRDVLAPQKHRAEQSPPRLDQLTLKRIGWRFDIVEGNIAEATYLGQGLSSRNLSIDVEETRGFSKKAHVASASDTFKNWCLEQHDEVPEGAFASLAGSLYDTSAAVQCNPLAGVRPEVVIVDQQIFPHPDLANALSEVSTEEATSQTLRASCEQLDFDRKRHHGMLLSTIVASNENDYGFVGMVPDATIAGFVWDQSTTNNDLKDIIRRVIKPTLPQVFLFASQFAPYRPPPPDDSNVSELRLAKATWRRTESGQWLDLLVNEEVRLRGLLPEEVIESPLLLITSAGQAAGGDEGQEISWQTPMPPQNLGDQKNVLVVGACIDCNLPRASLWKESNRSDATREFVSVLAPGGSEIPTYIPEHGVGVTIGGTSAAAAFVAGLAGRMAECHPLQYNAQPAKLKERIILASRPIEDPETVDRITGGVIDPGVSMLDPTQTWLKLKSENSQVRPVEFNHWCTERLKLQPDSGGTRDSLNLLATRRLTNVDALGVIHQSVVERSSKRIVKREPPGLPASEGPVAAVRYAERQQACAVPVNRLEDLFLSQESDAVADCSALLLCE